MHWFSVSVEKLYLSYDIRFFVKDVNLWMRVTLEYQATTNYNGSIVFSMYIYDIIDETLHFVTPFAQLKLLADALS